MCLAFFCSGLPQAVPVIIRMQITIIRNLLMASPFKCPLLNPLFQIPPRPPFLKGGIDFPLYVCLSDNWLDLSAYYAKIGDVWETDWIKWVICFPLPLFYILITTRCLHELNGKITRYMENGNDINMLVMDSEEIMKEDPAIDCVGELLLGHSRRITDIKNIIR